MTLAELKQGIDYKLWPPNAGYGGDYAEGFHIEGGIYGSEVGFALGVWDRWSVQFDLWRRSDHFTERCELLATKITVGSLRLGLGLKVMR